jgi:hypothetical protein
MDQLPIEDPMDSVKFRKYGKEMVDFIADYWDRLRDDYRPVPDVKPGFIYDMVN